MYAGKEFRGLAGEVAFQSERGGDLASLPRLEAHRRVDVLLDDFLRRLLGDFLDVHAALGAGHDQRAGVRAVEQHGEIKFLLDVLRRRDEHGAHDTAIRPGLLGDERIAEHGLRERRRFFSSLREFHAAFETVLEDAFAAAARVNL